MVVFEIAADDLIEEYNQGRPLAQINQLITDKAERKISSVEENIQIQIEDDYLISNIHHNINNTNTKGTSSLVTRRRDAGLIESSDAPLH